MKCLQFFNVLNLETKFEILSTDGGVRQITGLLSQLLLKCIQKRKKKKKKKKKKEKKQPNKQEQTVCSEI